MPPVFLFKSALAACLFACAAPKPAAPPSTCGFAEEQLIGAPMTYNEPTNPTISGYDVGVSNIWERDLPDDQGAVAQRPSASVAVFDPASKKEYHEKVFPGHVLSLGADRYCVTRVDVGSSTPGTITLRKLAP